MNAARLRRGKKLLAAREAADLSQADLCRLSLVDPTTISRLENGKTPGSFATWEAIAEALGRPLGWFLLDPIDFPSLTDLIAELGPAVPSEAVEHLRDTSALFPPDADPGRGYWSACLTAFLAREARP